MQTQPVHLCQPDGRKACGACCGMYNIVHGSRRRVTAILEVRTAAFHATCDVEDPNTLLAFRKARATHEQNDKLLGLLRNCPFLGILDAQTGRVGCLVHPKVNGGVDGRDCGVYDRDTCESYLCAAHTVLSGEERQLVIAACGDDSYLYGLVLNDVGFLRGLFQQVADIIGMWPRGPRLRHPTVLAAVAAFLSLKADWHYRDPEAGIIGAWIPDGDDNVAQRAVDYAELGVPRSPFDTILRSLGSVFEDEAELREAEAIVYGLVFDVASAFEALIPTDKGQLVGEKRVT